MGVWVGDAFHLVVCPGVLQVFLSFGSGAILVVCAAGGDDSGAGGCGGRAGDGRHLDMAGRAGIDHATDRGDRAGRGGIANSECTGGVVSRSQIQDFFFTCHFDIARISMCTPICQPVMDS